MQATFSFWKWITATCCGVILGIVLLLGCSPANAADLCKDFRVCSM